MEKQIINMKKELHTIKKKKIIKSTIETNFDKFGNKVLILETSNKVDEEKVTKKKIFYFQGMLLLHSYQV